MDPLLLSPAIAPLLLALLDWSVILPPWLALLPALMVQLPSMETASPPVPILRAAVLLLSATTRTALVPNAQLAKRGISLETVSLLALIKAFHSQE
jgi:hypothetical protein